MYYTCKISRLYLHGSIRMIANIRHNLKEQQDDKQQYFKYNAYIYVKYICLILYLQNINRNKTMTDHENKTLLQSIRELLSTYFKPIFLLSLLIAIWLGFEEKWISLSNTYIGSWLHLPDHWSIKLVLYIVLFGVSFLLYRLWEKRYQITWIIWTLLIFFLIVLFKYHNTSVVQRDPQELFGFITYFNLIFLILFLSILVLVGNRIEIQIKKIKSESKNKTASLWQVDEPIKEDEEDVYHWGEDIEKLIEEMDALSLSECAFKIGVVAPWGAGKSSYLNLLKKELKTKDYIVIDFNPRNAKECLSIQELFFHTLSEQLKQYHSGLSSLFQKYMLALQLISPEGWLSRSLSAFRELGRKEIRKELNTTIKDLPFKVVIVIEDLDRLVHEEILEIFKLLDTSASFPNTIYITAYDKNYLRNLFHNENSDSYKDTIVFSDKFFDLEYPMPSVSSKTLIEQLEKLIIEKLSLNNAQKPYNSVIQKYSPIFCKYLLNMRDVKRYVNLLITDYVLIDREIYIGDFLLISLIKYKSPEIHGYIYQDNIGEIINKKRQEYEISIPYHGPYHDIIALLFPPESNAISDDNKQENKMLKNKIVFRKYYEMHTQSPTIYPSLINSVLKLVKKKNTESLIEKIDILCKDRDSFLIKQLVDYFETTELTTHLSLERETLYNHLRVLSYLYSKWPNHQLAYRFCTIFFDDINENKSIQEEIVNWMGPKNEIKRQINNILSENWSYHAITKELIIRSINSGDGVISLKKPLLTNQELLDINKKHLDEYINSQPKEIFHIIEILSGCLAPPKGRTKRKNALDRECKTRVRNHIKTYPENYIDNLIKVHKHLSHPDIIVVQIDDSWKDIFEDSNDFGDFISSGTLSAEKTNLVRNVWKVFKKNDYFPIEFSNTHDVENLIKKDFNDSLIWLDELEKLEKEIYNPDSSKDIKTLQESIQKNGLSETKFAKKLLWRLSEIQKQERACSEKVDSMV